MKVYNKLVRDKIPAIIEASGKKANVGVMSDQEYEKALDVKLYEELNEYNEEKDINELADLIEVIYAIVEQKGLSIEEFEKIRSAKKEERGGFKEKLILYNVENNK